TYLNKAQRLLARDSKTIKSVDIAVTAGVITIPADCLIPRHIKYGGVKIDYSEKTMAVSTSTSTNPTLWTKRNGQIEVNTTVTVTALSGTCELFYTPRPAVMSGSNSPELADCDDALIAYARYKLYSDAEDEESAGYWEGEWLKERAEWLDQNVIQDFEIETPENILGW
ncbi:MAG: phage adaptor protein, partial [Thermincolia bacterium]